MNDKFSLLKKMRRLSGILVHPTSLPSKFGVGDLGPEAYRFVDFLQEAGQHLWQTLPLGPTGGHNSPYQCFSSFAGQPLLISPELLLQEGLLAESDLSNVPAFPEEEVDFKAVQAYKEELFKKAFTRFKELPEDSELKSELALFCKSSHWLDDYAMFMAIKKSKDGLHWLEWEKKYRKPTKSQKAVIERDLEDEILYEKFLQWTFFHQWSQLKAYANERDILLIGDIPIFVSGDSSDVWAEPRLFQVDSDGFPTVVAGVPPDYFSATGQLWGNPLYNWEAHEAEHFSWWISRIRAQLHNLDILRVDHFRGFEAFWSIPYGEPTAVNGEWVKAPGHALFSAVRDAFEGNLPIIAEDLGVITPEVEALRDEFGLPGMKVLQFAFDSLDEGSYLPHRYTSPVCVCYTGTHDNDTTRSWYQTLRPECRDKVRRYTHCSNDTHFPLDLIGTALASVAAYAIFPLQDVLCVGAEGRMNTPGIGAGNWSWRYQQSALKGELADELRGMTILYGRY